MNPSMPLHGGKKIAREVLKGEIEFRNVTFAYPTRPQNVNNLNYFYPNPYFISYIFRLYYKILIYEYQQVRPLQL